MSAIGVRKYRLRKLTRKLFRTLFWSSTREIQAINNAIDLFDARYGHADRDDRKESLAATFYVYQSFKTLDSNKSAKAIRMTVEEVFARLSTAHPEHVASFGTIAAWYREGLAPRKPQAAR